MKYGWKRSEHKSTDKMYDFVRACGEHISFPTQIDLRPMCPPVYDQLSLGSCTSNAGSGLAEVLMKKAGITPFTPSRLAMYYMERALEGTVQTDSGATIQDVMTVISTLGMAHETLWTYRPAAFIYKPFPNVYADALLHKIGTPMRIPRNLLAMKSILAQGFPFAIGIEVYQSFESANSDATGIITMPTSTETFLGGHAILIVGYNDATSMFTFRNSWGPSWGDGGYGYLPYAYLMNSELSDDFWFAETYTG